MSDYKDKSRKIARQSYWEDHDRATYECPDCGRTEDELRHGFEVHHKNGEPMDNRPENRVALCRPCHNLREGKKPSKRDIEQMRDSLKSSDRNQDDLAGQHSGATLLHVRNTLRVAYPKLSDCYDYSFDELAELEPQTSREQAIYDSGRRDEFGKHHGHLNEMLERIEPACAKCGDTGALIKHHDYHTDTGDRDPIGQTRDKWYMTYIDDCEYLCSDCHPDYDATGD